jgi:hypothetical protein
MRVRTVVWEGRSREAPPYPDLWPVASVSQFGPRPLLAEPDMRKRLTRPLETPNGDAFVLLSRLLRSENCLRDHAVDAFGAVDYLGDMIIDRDARNHVGFLTGKLGEALGDEKYALAHRHLHRLL